MILNFGYSVLAERRCYWSIHTVCFASPSSIIPTEQLRNELDNLHKEALDTSSKANSARLRLMRLSEAAEKLRNRAAISVRTGKEDDARELLFQKKKVRQAMEKLKTRIEVFDELSSTLNKAISMKENLLIDKMASDIELTDQTKAPSPVRIISPKEGNQDNLNDGGHLNPNYVESEEDEEPLVSSDLEWNNDREEESHIKKKSCNGKDVQASNEISTYENFMRQLDQQLNQVEEELETFLRISNLIFERKTKPEYSRIQHTTEILEAVRHTRERIASILQTENEVTSNELPH